MKNGNFAHRFLSENIHKITATRKMIVERMIIRILIFSLWVLIAILAKQNIIISRSSSKMAVFSEFDSSSFFGSLRNVGVVKSICKQVQMAAYQCSNHGISATGGFISHGYSFFRNRVSFVN